MKELMKKKQMFSFEEINNFYSSDSFSNNSTRQAWYVFCLKFLTCVNGEWLKCISGNQARNQVNMFRFITVSDEALVRWTLEIKEPKLIEEEKNGWPVNNGGRKPNGIHASRQYSNRYAIIHQQVKELRSSKAAEEWNNLFWSMYRYIHPKLFEDSSSEKSGINQIVGKTQHPDEDDYDPSNEKTAPETKIFTFNDEENPDQMKVLADIL
jgi:hypothetical protein